MEARRRDQIIPSHISKRVLNPSLKRVMKRRRLKRLTRRVGRLITLNLIIPYGMIWDGQESRGRLTTS